MSCTYTLHTRRDGKAWSVYAKVEDAMESEDGRAVWCDRLASHDHETQGAAFTQGLQLCKVLREVAQILGKEENQ